ncbi:c-type cytochrome [Achromobacter sp. MY14]|uniref:c-type cytochrome n=1 Tax=unclassified Achromobacter TaxID=2626865 RepID=UPI001E537A6F|nr:c-type cytochrome [Achromobacter sp. MY14]
MRTAARPVFMLFGAATLSLLAACGDERPALAPNLTAAALPERADAVRGRQWISEYGCLACHAVPSIRGPASSVGPPLGNVGRQAYLTGLLPNTPQNLVRWLMDPPAINARTAMPNVGLSQAEAEDIAAFLLSLPESPEPS